MGAAEKIHWTPLRMTVEEYLEWERTSPEKWEYLDGEVVPVHGYIYENDEIVGMAGALPRHNLLSANVIAEVRFALRDKPCRAYSADLKVQAGKNYVFPDATIICGKLELKEGSRDIVTNPKVVFEVLSDSTEFKDRTLKLRDYFKLKSLQEYVLINQNQALVEQYIRQEDGSWALRILEAGETLYLRSCDAKISVDAIYDGAFDENFTGTL